MAKRQFGKGVHSIYSGCSCSRRRGILHKHYLLSYSLRVKYPFLSLHLVLTCLRSRSTPRSRSRLFQSQIWCFYRQAGSGAFDWKVILVGVVLKNSNKIFLLWINTQLLAILIKFLLLKMHHFQKFSSYQKIL